MCVHGELAVSYAWPCTTSSGVSNIRRREGSKPGGTTSLRTWRRAHAEWLCMRR
jgi:hypothetical protein